MRDSGVDWSRLKALGSLNTMPRLLIWRGRGCWSICLVSQLPRHYPAHSQPSQGQSSIVTELSGNLIEALLEMVLQARGNSQELARVEWELQKHFI